MLDGAPAEYFRCAVFLCVRSLDFAIGILINDFFSVQGFQLTMGKNDNSNSHGRQFRCSPWKVSKLVFPWAAFLNPTMGKPKNRLSMEEFPGFNHGKLEKINFHGQIFPLSPWKNPMNHFPWTETGSCSMEIFIIKNTMDGLQEKYHGKTRNPGFHGRSSPNCPWNFYK